MSDKTADTGTIEAILQRFNDFRLPRLLELKERVDQGEKLQEHDLDLLERAQADARSIEPLVKRRPELQALYSKATSLYQEITAKGLENEKNK